MKRDSLLFILAFVTFLVSSCSSIPIIVLFNNSGKNFTIYADDKVYYVKKESVIEVEYPSSQTMKIEDEGDTWEYKFTYPPREYMPGRLLRMYEIHCQIEPDGSIYVLKPGVSMPVKGLPPQPDGFPLVPTQS